MKVVIDTNILIGSTSDEFSHSKRIIDEVIAGNIEAYGTNPIIRENQLLLEKAVPNPKQKEFLEDFFAQLQEVSVTSHVHIIEADPEDDKFVNAALSADAEYIITNDDHLLFHDGYQGLKIKTPKDFWNMYEQEKEDHSGPDLMLGLMGKR